MSYLVSVKTYLFRKRILVRDKWQLILPFNPLHVILMHVFANVPLQISSSLVLANYISSAYRTMKAMRIVGCSDEVPLFCPLLFEATTIVSCSLSFLPCILFSTGRFLFIFLLRNFIFRVSLGVIVEPMLTSFPHLYSS